MSAPISPRDLGILLACGAVLPVAACFGAYPFDGRNRRKLNILSYSIGLVAIAIVAVILHENI